MGVASSQECIRNLAPSPGILRQTSPIIKAREGVFVSYEIRLPPELSCLPENSSWMSSLNENSSGAKATPLLTGDTNLKFSLKHQISGGDSDSELANDLRYVNKRTQPLTFIQIQWNHNCIARDRDVESQSRYHAEKSYIAC